MNQKADLRPGLAAALAEVGERCTLCRSCVLKCDFLARFGNPGEIAKAYDPDKAGTMPFLCSLCGLCGAVCPESLEPAEMFLAMRRQAVDRGEAPYREHARVLNYERRGLSDAFTLEALPRGCETVFFPGCTLPGTRPKTTLALFTRLRAAVPGLGVVMRCCSKPSHDLGMQEHFETAFMPLGGRLLDAGVRTVLAACPNCYKVFARYGGEIKVRSVYEVLAESGAPAALKGRGRATVHDSCAVRFESGLHTAARLLAEGAGLELTEMRSKGRKTLCCGEGGTVAALDASLAGTWTRKRVEQAGGERLVTYCAGCAGYLSPHADVVHLADLITDPERALSGRAKVARSPFTYLNRLLLKRRFARLLR